jgi:hypothetical protein
MVSLGCPAASTSLSARYPCLPWRVQAAFPRGLYPLGAKANFTA